MKILKTPIKKELADYTKAELIALLTGIEEQFNSKNERLRTAHTKLTRARIRIRSQKQRLQHLRKRIGAYLPAWPQALKKF